MIDDGPYAYVRHPGYSASILVIFGFPLVLGSILAYLPLLLAAFLLIIRTYLEDVTLSDKLPGFSDYTKKGRWRLIPCIW